MIRSSPFLSLEFPLVATSPSRDNPPPLSRWRNLNPDYELPVMPCCSYEAYPSRAFSLSRRIEQALVNAFFLPCLAMDTEVFPCLPWSVTQLTSYRFNLSFRRTPTTPVPELLTVTMCLLVRTFPSFFSVLSLQEIADRRLEYLPPHFLSEKNFECVFPKNRTLTYQPCVLFVSWSILAMSLCFSKRNFCFLSSSIFNPLFRLIIIFLAPSKTGTPCSLSTPR